MGEKGPGLDARSWRANHTNVRFNPPSDCKNLEQRRVVVIKILKLRLNYWLIKILKNLSRYYGLQVGNEWNNEKKAEKN